MNSSVLNLAASAAFLFSAMPSLAATVVFDDFTAPQIAVDQPFVGVSNTSSVAFNSGERILTANNTANIGDSTAATRLEVAGGALRFSNNDSATGRGTLTYTNVGDISEGANPYFLFDVGFFDGIAEFFATAMDTMGGISTYQETLQPGYNPQLFFAQFNGNADFNSLSDLSFAIDTTGGQISVDGSLNSISISAVPLPAGGFLLFAGLAGLAALRRKKSA